MKRRKKKDNQVEGEKQLGVGEKTVLTNPPHIVGLGADIVLRHLTPVSQQGTDDGLADGDERVNQEQLERGMDAAEQTVRSHAAAELSNDSVNDQQLLTDIAQAEAREAKAEQALGTDRDVLRQRKEGLSELGSPPVAQKTNWLLIAFFTFLLAFLVAFVLWDNLLANLPNQRFALLLAGLAGITAGGAMTLANLATYSLATGKKLLKRASLTAGLLFAAGTATLRLTNATSTGHLMAFLGLSAVEAAIFIFLHWLGSATDAKAEVSAAQQDEYERRAGLVAVAQEWVDWDMREIAEARQQQTDIKEIIRQREALTRAIDQLAREGRAVYRRGFLKAKAVLRGRFRGRNQKEEIT